MNLDSLYTLLSWTPDLLRGFGINVGMSVLTMALATALGIVLGAMQSSSNGVSRRASSLVTQGLRNSPWLVVMFYVMYLVPFEIQIFGAYVEMSGWLKASIGLAVPAAGYVSEVVRGGIRAIPVTQWDAAAALALDRHQALRLVILPQALRSMVPPWMNIYCTVLMSTSLASILSVEEVMTTLQSRLAGETRPDLLLPAYALAFVLFFVFVYPIARVSRRLEARWRVHA